MIKKAFLIAAFLLTGILSYGQNADEKAVAAAVEKLRAAMVDPTEAALDKLAAPSLSYGHSNGLLEDKKEFVRALVSEESNFTKIELLDQTITVSGDVALVRHKLIGETHNKGKDPGQVKIGILLVWQKTKGNWQLLGRQAFKLP
jgi:hypothetical protein